MSTKRSGKKAKRGLDYSEDKREMQSQNDEVDVVDLTGAVTPQKKKKRNLNDFFGSPDSAATSTPAAKRSSSAAVVTPPEIKVKRQKKDKRAAAEEENKEKENVPTYLHKNVEYLRKGQADLSEKTLKIFHWIEKHFEIPEGFENNRAFGPLSGVCFEERAIAAYTNHLLTRREDADAGAEICTCCASDGHKRDDCPTLI